jgi:hypothetical protein
MLNAVRRTALALLLVCLAFALAPSGTRAGVDLPKKAHKLQMSLVSAYNACSVFDTQSGGGKPGCLNPYHWPSPDCTLGGQGSGLVKGGVVGSPGNSDVKFSFSLKGIQNCEGQYLCPFVTVAATGDSCDDGFGNFTQDCTLVTFDLRADAPYCCTVTGGVCKIKTTLRTALPGLLSAGERWSTQVLGVGLYWGGARAFVGGVFLP